MTATDFATLDGACALNAEPLPPRSGLAEFARYFGCSAAALAADVLVYALAMRCGAGYAFAAVLGFCIGLWLSYAVSVRWVFASRRVESAGMEFLVFASVGLAGLLVTEALLWIFVTRLGIGPLIAKGLTAGIVFVFNFGARKALLFTRSARRITA
jgi:putative flippase GtrA